MYDLESCDGRCCLVGLPVTPPSALVHAREGARVVRRALLRCPQIRRARLRVVTRDLRCPVGRVRGHRAGRQPPWVRNRRNAGPATAGSAGSADPPSTARTDGTCCLDQRSRHASVDTRHRARRPGSHSTTPLGLASAGRVAERVGFEPTKSFDSALFKSAAINRSATSPVRRIPATPPGSESGPPTAPHTEVAEPASDERQPGQPAEPTWKPADPGTPRAPPVRPPDVPPAPLFEPGSTTGPPPIAGDDDVPGSADVPRVGAGAGASCARAPLGCARVSSR